MTPQNDSDSRSRPQVKLQVLSVVRKTSPGLPTTRYTYNDKGEPEPKMTVGAEWEEIEFAIIQEEKPTIQISNIIGSVFLGGNIGKLFINNPDLFGTYKAGDTISFMPITILPNNTEIPEKEPETKRD